MKILIYTLAISLAFASCDFSDGETANNQPIITVETDTTIPAKVDNTAVSEPDEIPVAQLPANASKQAVQSMDLVVTTTPGMKVEDLETFLLICDSEVVKDAKCFTMKHFKATPITDGMIKVKLNGRPFHYQQNFTGTLMILMGYLKLGDKWYKVDAEDTEPEWIFPYLATMEPKPAL